jgi:asparagine synthase (glutamine-hydrolysing)
MAKSDVLLRDPYGVKRIVYRPKGPHATCARALLGAEIPTLDAEGIRAAWGDAPESDHTCFQGIKAVPRGHRLAGHSGGWRIEAVSTAPKAEPSSESTLSDAPLVHVLVEAMKRSLSGKRIALALSGGLDSALVLLLMKIAGLTPPPIYTLAPKIAGYDESDRAERTARHFGLEVTKVPLTEKDFVAALPAAVAAAEVPLFNLHPVSKLLLARHLVAEGFDAVLTGDGADEVFSFNDRASHLPIVGALFRSCGVELVSPYLDPVVIARAATLTLDPDKRALRIIAAGEVPDELVREKKAPRTTPAIDVSKHWSDAEGAALAKASGLTMAIRDERDQVCWTTLLLLAKSFGVVS